jgi:ArsR family metal-binding transcriptional regulator
MEVLTTFAALAECTRAVGLLRHWGISHRVISPEPAYTKVGCPAVVLDEEDRIAFLRRGGQDVLTVGWVNFREPAHPVPGSAPAADIVDVIGRVVIVLLAPCVSDDEKLRITAHFGGDASQALPYLNALMPQAAYMASAPVLSYMDGHRMIAISPHRITVAKADDIVDAWATLEKLRRLVNDVWSRRGEIAPSSAMRRRPSALEILRRLPGTNCRACGEQSCTGFAWAVWRGDADVRACRSAFEGGRGELKEALLAICEGMGLPAR